MMTDETQDKERKIQIAASQNENEYTAESIQVLEGLEAVRKRPAMYIGDTDRKGLHHLVYEVVDNSIDEALAGFAKNIEVILKSDGSVSVRDDGRGIPTEKHSMGKSALEVVTTTLHAGGKFEKKAYRVSGGLHGVGLSMVNALSEWMEAEVHRGGKIYRQRYSRGNALTSVEIVGDTSYRGTIVRFKPDAQIFSTVEFDCEIVRERLRELAYLNSRVRIELRDERTNSAEVFFFEGGLAQFVEHLNKTRNRLHAPIYFRKEVGNIEAEVALQYTNSYSEMIYSFANDIKTVDGGTHVSGFRTGLTRVLNDYGESNKILKNGMKISGDDAVEGLTAVVSVKVPEPQFEGQTKGKLGNGEVRGYVDSFFSSTFKQYLEENPSVAKAILAKSMSAMEAREAAQKAKDLIRRKSVFESSVLPGKLADCSEEDPAKSELFLVEGDSAGGCFSGDTKIALVDGRNVSFRELVKEDKEGKQNFCYTIRENGQIGIAPIKYPRLTKRGARVIKLIMDNGEEIVCTPDHQFMLRNCSYVKAEKLTTLTSLMPLYRPHQNKEYRRKIRATMQTPATRRRLKEAAANYNHKIVKIVQLDETMDVYDIEVEETHNFALASGVFVHNSSKQGRDRRYQAILPLKGKILNVEKAPLNKILMNNEIRNVVLALGTGFGSDLDVKKLRYHKILIMTDADVDGSHIRTLLLTLFYKHFRQLIENGYVYAAMPPLYRIKKGKAEKYAYNDEELARIVAEFGGEGEIQRYKGLGEMNASQLWETTMDPEKRTLKKVTIEDAMKADEMFSLLMGDAVEPRRAFIEQYAREVKNLDI